MHSPLGMWRVSLERMRVDWPIVGAAWLITLLAATLLAAGPIYSSAVSLAGLHRVLADAPVPDANVAVTLRADVADAQAIDTTVSRALRDAMGDLPTGGPLERAVEHLCAPRPGPGRGARSGRARLRGRDRGARWPGGGSLAGGRGRLGADWCRGSGRGACRRDARVGGRRAGADQPARRQHGGQHPGLGHLSRHRPTDPFWWEDAALAGRISDRYRTIGPLHLPDPPAGRFAVGIAAVLAIGIVVAYLRPILH